jgi:hypothetical protein
MLAPAFFFLRVLETQATAYEVVDFYLDARVRPR